MRRAGIGAIVIILAGAAAFAAATGASTVIQTKAVFLPGRPVAGERFSGAITYWTGHGAGFHVSGGLCEASIRTGQGGLQRRLGSGTAHPLPDDGSLPGADAWSWRVPRTAAGKVLVVVCGHVIARVDTTESGEQRIRVVKTIRPGFVHRWRIVG